MVVTSGLPSKQPLVLPGLLIPSHKNMFALPRRPAQSKRWCFTINNWTPDHEHSLELVGLQSKYLVYGREVGESGTPHLQGFIIFDTNHRFESARTKLPPGAHLEVARSPSHTAAAYCKKDHDFTEFGNCPVPGKTNRYEDFHQWVVSHGTRPTMADVANSFPSIFMQSGRVQSFIDLVYPHVFDAEGEYRHYQLSLERELTSAFADCRKIIFVVDPEGNSGKSWFVDKFYHSHPLKTQILSIGKREDLSFAVDERKSVFLFDLPRSASEFLPYVLLEQLKDRRIFSNKYESRMKVLPFTPHVCVFTNEYPDMTKLSSDRYDIIVWNKDL